MRTAAPVPGDTFGAGRAVRCTLRTIPRNRRETAFYDTVGARPFSRVQGNLTRHPARTLPRISGPPPCTDVCALPPCAQESSGSRSQRLLSPNHRWEHLRTDEYADTEHWPPVSCAETTGHSHRTPAAVEQLRAGSPPRTHRSGRRLFTQPSREPLVPTTDGSPSPPTYAQLRPDPTSEPVVNT